jgi:hypothetical protein
MQASALVPLRHVRPTISGLGCVAEGREVVHQGQPLRAPTLDFRAVRETYLDPDDLFEGTHHPIAGNLRIPATIELYEELGTRLISKISVA